MRTLAILACLLMAGCAQREADGPNLGQIQKACGWTEKPIVATWPCVKTGVASMPMFTDVREVYSATGDFVVEQIAAGKMTEAEARLAMAQARQRAYDVTTARENAANQRDAARDAFAIGMITRGGFQTQPAPYYSTPPQIISTQRGSIMCQRTGPNSVYCG